MPRFKEYNYRQTAMVPVDFEQQILPGTFEYSVHYRAVIAGSDQTNCLKNKRKTGISPPLFTLTAPFSGSKSAL